MSKKEQAQKLYNEMAAAAADKAVVRKVFIQRAVDELGMTAAGASTYYSNCKTVASGGEVKSYYTPSSEKKVTQAVDDSKADAPLWSIVVVEDDKVASTASFMSAKGAATKWNNLKPTTQARCLVVEGSPATGSPISGLTKIDPVAVV